jgi:CheY-like chemotaxis protein
MSRIKSWLRPGTDEDVHSYGSLPFLLGLVGLGFVGIFVYAIQFGGDGYLIASVGSMVAGASLIVGGLLGFLFGIPRSLASDRPRPNDKVEDDYETNGRATDFQANTNLEQISDWLTKILVGVGLAKISGISEGLNGTANALQGGLGGPPQNHLVALTILVYFPVCGFLIGYLWTRLFLAPALTRSETARIKERERRKAETNAIKELSESVSKAQPAARSNVYGLWVDDNPSNNASLKESFEKLLGIEFDLSSSTEDALAKAENKRYSVIISDMGRPPDRRAGYTLLRRLKESSGPASKTPYIIYASGASVPANRDAAIDKGAFGSTSSPQDLLKLVRTALEKSST